MIKCPIANCCFNSQGYCSFNKNSCKRHVQSYAEYTYPFIPPSVYSPYCDNKQFHQIYKKAIEEKGIKYE